MDKPGCRWLVSIVMFMFAIGFLLGGRAMCNAGPQNGEENADLGTVLGNVGDVPIYDRMVQDDATGQINPGTSSPADYAKGYGRAFDKEVTQALLLVIAKQKGVSIDEDEVKKAVENQFDENITMQKEMLGFQNKVPQNATDQQLDAYFKTQGQPSIADQRNQEVQGYLQAYQDPGKKTLVERAIANDLVMGSIESGINITDEELKHSNDQYVTKVIVFNAAKHPGVDIQKQAQQVLADLRAKKISFDDAMDKYTDQPSQPGKKAHENTDLISMGTLKSDPNYQPLINLKPGDFSDVLPDPPQGVGIYQLQSIQSQPIPNFDKQKDTMRKTQLEQQAATELQAELKKARSSTKITWNSPGCGVLYNWFEATQMDNTFNSESVPDQHKAEKGYIDQGTKAGDSYGLLAAAGAIDPIWTSATDTQKKALSPEYLKILSDLLQSYPSYSGCMQMVKLAIDAKDKQLVYQGLSMAAQVNGQSMDEAGLSNFHDLSADLEKYQSEGLISSDQATTIRKYLDSWKTSKTQYDAGMLKQQKELAAEKAKADAEKAAAAKKQAAQGPPAAKPMVGGQPGARPPTVPLAPPKNPPNAIQPIPSTKPGPQPVSPIPPAGKGPAPVKPAAPQASGKK